MKSFVPHNYQQYCIDRIISMQERRPSFHHDRGVSWVFSSCGASVGFLTRYDGELRETLMWCRGSQIFMRVVRGSASFFSSHGRGIGHQDA